jgi:hypothetical protein
MHEMLSGLNSEYHTLLEVADDLDDWGIYTDLVCYKNYDIEQWELLIEQQIVSNQLCKATQWLEACRFWLEACRIATHLQGLQG